MLAAAAKTESTQQWERHFGRALIQVLNALTVNVTSEKNIFEAALQCLQQLLQHQSSFFDDFAEVVASEMFDAHRLCGEEEEKLATISIDRT